MTILDLMKEDGVDPKRTSSKCGDKYDSPCPGCGGTDRFQYWPDAGNYYCRKCNKKGSSVIDYLVHFRGMTKEECIKAGFQATHKRIMNPRKPARLIAEQDSSKTMIPFPMWQKKASAFVEWAEECLWDDHYVGWRTWLSKERGLNGGTINAARLGWLPVNYYPERNLWGLPEKLKEDGTPAKLFIPSGLIIPVFHDGQIQKIKIRLFNPTNGNRYHFIEGSSTSPMILGSGKTIIIVESELDAILLDQEAGDLVTIIALGSAYVKPGAIERDLVNKAEKVLIALDRDEAGGRVSWKDWLQEFSNAVRWPVIKGKDPTEAFLNGLDLRAWIVAGIRKGKRAEIVPPTFKLLRNHDDLTANLEKCKSSTNISLSIISQNDSVQGDTHYILLSAPDQPVLIIDLAKFDNKSDLLPLREILAESSRKIFYDAKTTLKQFSRANICMNGDIFDMGLADQILNAGLDKAGIISSKGIFQSYNTPLTDLQLQQAAYESMQLLKLKDILIHKLEESGLMETAKLEFDCIKATMAMEMNGFQMDEDKLEKMQKECIPILSRHEEILKKDLGDINLNSPNEVLAALKLKGIDMDNTKDDTLTPLSADYPMIKRLIAYRKASHILKTINNLLSNTDQGGRIHPHYKQIGAPTGRFSCSEPNLQGIPKGILRSCFITAPGHKLIIADYSQIELRIVAEITGDEKMIQAYRDGDDLHKLTASILMGKPIDQVTKEERQAAKAVNFGLIYAMGARD